MFLFQMRYVDEKKKTPDAKLGEVAPRPKKLLGMRITKRIDLEREMREDGATPIERAYFNTLKREYKLSPERTFDLFSYYCANKSMNLEALDVDLRQLAEVQGDYKLTVKENGNVIKLRDRINANALFKDDPLTVRDVLFTLQRNSGIVLGYDGEAVEYDAKSQSLMSDQIREAERKGQTGRVKRLKRADAVLKAASDSKLESAIVKKLAS